MIPRTQIDLHLEPGSFKLLLDAVAIAQWVVCAGDQPADEATDNYRASIDRLQQELLCEGESSGFSDVVGHDQESIGRLCHHEFEEGAGEAWWAVEQHDEEMFWEELVWRMAPMMALRMTGKSRWKSLPEQERAQCVCECERRVREVIDRHGLGGIMLTTAVPAC